MKEAQSKAEGAVWPLVKTAFFFALVPTTVAGYVPWRILRAPQIPPLSEWGAWQYVGATLVALGAAGLVWCGWHFAVTGLGTPAPFDPPKKLVVRGPYRYVRNPMYFSVVTVLAGESLFFASWALVRYLVFCWVVVHLFVLLYEEPTLRGKFDADYEEYCRKVWRWVPRFPGSEPPPAG